MYKHKLTKNLNNLEDANLPDDAVMFKESNNVETFVPKMLIVAIIVTIIFVSVSKVISDIHGVPYRGANYFTWGILLLWVFRLYYMNILMQYFTEKSQMPKYTYR